MAEPLVVGRALSQVDRPVIYKLGAGGMNPHAPGPENHEGKCDCSGFTAWCCGISRLSKDPVYVAYNGGWINTDSICYDAKRMSDGGLYMLIGKLKDCHPEPGHLLVYPGQGGRPGHIGVVTGEDSLGLLVTHCSSGNYRRSGKAIQQTRANVFFMRNDTIVVSFK